MSAAIFRFVTPTCILDELRAQGGFDPPSRGLLCGVAVVCGFLISSRKRSVCGWSSNHLPAHLVTGLPVLSFSGSWVGESRSCVQSGYGPAINRRVTSRSERVRGRQHGRSASLPGTCVAPVPWRTDLRAGAGGSFRDHPAVRPVSLRPSLSSAGSLPVPRSGRPELMVGICGRVSSAGATSSIMQLPRTSPHSP